MKSITWLRVGGDAEIFFQPLDLDDHSKFLLLLILSFKNFSKSINIRFLELGAGCPEFDSLHPDQYSTTTPLKMLKLKLILIQHDLINILNFSF